MKTNYIHLFIVGQPFEVANKPLNPNLLSIGWDKCDEWYHPKWQGLTDEAAKNIDDFICIRCRNI